MSDSEQAEALNVTAAILVNLLRLGFDPSMLEVLTYGDGRGTIAAGALEKAVRAALATTRGHSVAALSPTFPA